MARLHRAPRLPEGAADPSRYGRAGLCRAVIDRDGGRRHLDQPGGLPVWLKNWGISPTLAAADPATVCVDAVSLGRPGPEGSGGLNPWPGQALKFRSYAAAASQAASTIRI